MSVSDIRLKAKAIEQRWNIPEDYRDVLIKQMLRVVADPNTTPREKTSAARAIIAAEAQNQADDNARLQQRGNRFLEVATALGITHRPIDVLDSRTDDDSIVDDDRLQR